MNEVTTIELLSLKPDHGSRVCSLFTSPESRAEALEMTLPPPRLFNPMKDLQLLPQFAQIHTDCITHDHQLATFLPPLEKGKMEAYWGKIAGRVSSGEVDIVIQFAETSDSDGAEKEVAGYVCLMMPPTETGPFRASVEKLMVSPRHRRKGIAKRVMGVLEDVARSKHRELLVSRCLASLLERTT